MTDTRRDAPAVGRPGTGWLAFAGAVLVVSGVPVASEGFDVAEVVEPAAWRLPAPWLDRLRRLAAERRPYPAVRPPELTEHLTDRERDVLRFLPSRLTVPEIAEELHLSVNTLKFHLKAIYRKLGVGSRAEAAQVARRMTLI